MPSSFNCWWYPNLYPLTFPLTCLLTTKVVTTNITTGCARQVEDRAQWGHKAENKITDFKIGNLTVGFGGSGQHYSGIQYAKAWSVGLRASLVSSLFLWSYFINTSFWMPWIFDTLPLLKQILTINTHYINVNSTYIIGNCINLLNNNNRTSYQQQLCS